MCLCSELGTNRPGKSYREEIYARWRAGLSPGCVVGRCAFLAEYRLRLQFGRKMLVGKRSSSQSSRFEVDHSSEVMTGLRNKQASAQGHSMAVQGALIRTQQIRLDLQMKKVCRVAAKAAMGESLWP
jgi:hypothetical protein